MSPATHLASPEPLPPGGLLSALSGIFCKPRALLLPFRPEGGRQVSGPRSWRPGPQPRAARGVPGPRRPSHLPQSTTGSPLTEWLTPAGQPWVRTRRGLHLGLGAQVRWCWGYIEPLACPLLASIDPQRPHRHPSTPHPSLESLWASTAWLVNFFSNGKGQRPDSAGRAAW